jgi:hypothetical protein
MKERRETFFNFLMSKACQKIRLKLFLRNFNEKKEERLTAFDYAAVLGREKHRILIMFSY